MKVLMRQIQKVRSDKWDEYESIDKRYGEIEAKLGYPRNKRRYRALFGPHDCMTTAVVEYTYDSLAAMEALFAKAEANPDYAALGRQIRDIVTSDQIELYTLLP